MLSDILSNILLVRLLEYAFVGSFAVGAAITGVQWLARRRREQRAREAEDADNAAAP